RALGLMQKGHLGVGADADVTLYHANPEGGVLFEYPRYVIKGGEVVVEDGDIRSMSSGRQFLVQPSDDEHIEEFLRPVVQEGYTMSLDTYAVEMERISHPDVQACGR